jgi:hypothetical protein
MRASIWLQCIREECIEAPVHRDRGLRKIVFRGKLFFSPFYVINHRLRFPVSEASLSLYPVPYTGNRKPIPYSYNDLCRYSTSKVQNSQSSLQRLPRLLGRSVGEDGVVLPSVLMLLAVLTVVSATSITATLMDLKISGYYGKTVVVFYIAEAGINRGRYEVSNGDGDRDFASIVTPTTLFQSEALNGGSYTVIATPVEGAVPAQLTLKSSACYPAATDPCPRNNATAVVEVLLESNPEATEQEDRVRLLAWKEVY